MPEIDLVNNLQVTGQNRFQHANGPTLQGFGQNCMVGVCTRANSQFPGLRIINEFGDFGRYN